MQDYLDTGLQSRWKKMNKTKSSLKPNCIEVQKEDLGPILCQVPNSVNTTDLISTLKNWALFCLK